MLLIILLGNLIGLATIKGIDQIILLMRSAFVVEEAIRWLAATSWLISAALASMFVGLMLNRSSIYLVISTNLYIFVTLSYFSFLVFTHYLIPTFFLVQIPLVFIVGLVAIKMGAKIRS